MPDELWKDVQDIVQEKGTKNITKAKWLSGEALQIAVKRRDMKKRKGMKYPFKYRVPKKSKEK